MKKEVIEVAPPTAFTDSIVRPRFGRDVPSKTAKGDGIGELVFYGVMVGTLIGLRGNANPLVGFSGNETDAPLFAKSMVNLSDKDIGREVVVMFEGGDTGKPIVLGFIQHGVPEEEVVGKEEPRAPELIEIRKNNESLILTAEKEIVLRCGEASITLTRDGRVTVRGASLLSRSSGPNRIKGASIQLN